MRPGLRPRLTYANVTATLALFVALSGGAYAATALPANSVGSKQLKKSAVGTTDIQNNAITGAKIKLSSVAKVPAATTADMSTNASHAVASAALDKVTYKTVAATAPAGSAANVATATCDSGQHVVGGGVKLDSPGVGLVNDSYPDGSGTAWTAHVGNASNGSNAAPVNFTVYAICTTVTSTG
jgi:uncharacterized iron-regulated membrane protein